jgi:hypothetical protein
MMEKLQECRVFHNLEHIFDAVIAATTVTAAEATTDCVDSVFDCDVLEALRASAVNVQPSSPPLPCRPTERELIVAVELLARPDRRKLQRRFHPDRLKRSLGRDPTVVEQALSTKAMQAVNLLFSDEVCSSDVKLALGIMADIQTATATGSAGEADATGRLSSTPDAKSASVDVVADMLAGLRFAATVSPAKASTGRRQ